MLSHRKTLISSDKLNQNKISQTIHSNYPSLFSNNKKSKKLSKGDIKIDKNNSQQAKIIQSQYFGTEMVYSKPKFSFLSVSKVVRQIEHNVNQFIQNSAGFSYNNSSKILTEQAQIDEDFELKIRHNKNILRMQREKKIGSSNQNSCNILAPNKLPLIRRKFSEIQNINNLSLNKIKCKSLLPSTQKLSSLKSIKNPDSLSKFDQNNIAKKAQLKSHQKKSHQLRLNRFSHQGEYSVPKDQIDLYYPPTLHPHTKEKSKKKLAELKIQSKITDLTKRISQRSSVKNRLSTQLSSKFDKLNPTTISSENQSIFDNIQQFLSNPYENHSKNYSKFPKKYEKSGCSDIQFSQQKQLLKQKIKKLQQKCKDLQQNHHQQYQNTISYETPHQIHQQNIPKRQDDRFSKYNKLEDQDNFDNINFENQLKYIQRLEQKNETNLKLYVENKLFLEQYQFFKQYKYNGSKNNQTPIQINSTSNYLSG